jgi:hypothetical protein
MGEFSRKELLILDKSIEQIESQILMGIEENADKDRMLYASCLNDEEKEELTKKEIKKQQKKIVKCPADISAYITAYIKANSVDVGDDNADQFRERIIRNYVASTFVEVCENLLRSKFNNIAEIKAEDDSFWELLIDDQYYGVDDDSIRAFIKFMIIADRLKGYKSIFESIDSERALEEYNKLIEEDENEIYKLLDDVRAKEYTGLQLFKILKEQTNLDHSALKHFKNDVEIYLFSEKDAYEANFTFEQKEEALKEKKEKGNSTEDLLRLGYLREALKLPNQRKEGDKPSYYINTESLLFPWEFYSIYELMRIINSEIAKHEKQPTNKDSNLASKQRLNVNLSVPQLALLFKMIADLKPSVLNVNSEAELLRFISANFQTKQSNPDNGISEQKLRILFNQPDNKAIEFWEKHLRTMQAEIKKIK